MNNALSVKINKKQKQIFICEVCHETFSSKGQCDSHQKEQEHGGKGTDAGSKGNPGNAPNAGIFVRGYPSTSNEADLIKYFSQFGSVIWAHFGYDFLLLDFTDTNAVDKVLKKTTHFLCGQKLFVTRKEPRKNVLVPTDDEELNNKLYQFITSALSNINNFDLEFLCLARQLQPNPNGAFQKYNAVCRDIFTSLSVKFPTLQVHPFGSTLTGLSFNNSDIDVFLSNLQESGMDETSCLNVIKRFLAKSNKFGNCFVIRGAKIPIVKCLHLRTKIRCDINIKNMLGVCNSKLIHYYLSLDIKIKQAMIVLKYWAKCHKITGQQHLLTNYSLTLLFIFCLQQNPFHLPSLLSLQQPSTLERGFWNVNFLANYNFSPPQLNSFALIDLVTHFFRFYSNFPYATDIICPYLGCVIPKSEFKNPEGLPDPFASYKAYVSIENNDSLKVNSCVCLQDPFEHCRNTTGNVTESVLERFVNSCKLGEKICSERQNVLYKLLTVLPPPVKKFNYIFKDDVLKMTLSKSKNVQYLANQNGSEDDLWYDSVVRFITMVLEDFLQLTLLKNTDEASSSNNEGDPNKLAFICSGKINMCQARRATAKTLNLKNSNSTLVERETAITNHLKNIYKDVESLPDIVNFKLIIKNMKGEVGVQVEKITAYKNSFRCFVEFFATHVPSWFESYEKDLNKATANV